MGLFLEMRLRNLGFSSKVAEGIKRSNIVPLGLVRALGPGRLATPEDLRGLEEVLDKFGYYYTDKVAKNLTQIAASRDYSLQDIIRLASAREGGISLKDITGYEQVGILTVPGIIQAFGEGLTNGSELPEYFALGLRIPEMVMLRRAGVPPESVAGYRKAGVYEIASMADLSEACVLPESVTGYHEAGVHEIASMADLMEAGINSKGAIIYSKAGVTTPKAMKALFTSSIGPYDVDNYVAAGFDKPADMIFLKGHGCDDRQAHWLAKLGFSGNRNAMVKMVEAGLGPGKNREEVESYVKAGFPGDADSMIALHEQGVPGTFALSHTTLAYNGDRPAGTKELLNSVLDAFRNGRANSTPANA